MTALLQLSRRERQIVDALFRLRKATAAEIRAAMPDPPSYTAVRTTLRILEDKGAVSHEERDGKYWYSTTESRRSARTRALHTLLDTFFSGSASQAAVALLGATKNKLTAEDIDELSQIIERAKKELSR